MTTSHIRALLAALALAVFAGSTTAQVSWRDEGIPNATSIGSAVLTSRIFYPSTQTGANAPLRPMAGGYPVVVFLNGIHSLGSSYAAVGERLADAGFIAVHCDTGQLHDLQRDDGLALFDSLQAENARTGSFWHGALDMTRAAVSGHSMGGASTVRILAVNPGYRTGICFAPWHGSGAYPQHYAPQVFAPLLIIHGEGDGVLPWHSTAQAYFDHTASYADLKSFVLLNHDCDHSNLVRLNANATAAEAAVFARSMDTAIGWLSEHLRNKVNGLEQVLGPTLVGDPLVTNLQSGIREPKLWAQGAAVLGGTINLRLAGEPGLALLMLADAPANIPTNLGTLQLDPATLNWIHTFLVGGGAQSVNLHVPNDPNLLGLRTWFQALTLTDGRGVRFSNSVSATGTR